jgi:hypothetical protein
MIVYKAALYYGEKINNLYCNENKILSRRFKSFFALKIDFFVVFFLNTKNLYYNTEKTIVIISKNQFFKSFESSCTWWAKKKDCKFERKIHLDPK